MITIKTLITYASKYRKEITLQVIFATLWVVTALIIPKLMANIIDYGIAKSNMRYVYQTGIIMIVVTVLNIVFLLVNIYFLTRANAGISRDLRHDIFEKVIRFSKHTRQDFSTSTLITRNINDVKQVSNFIDLSLRKIYTTSITIIGAVIIAFSLDVKLALLMFIIVPIVLIVASKLTNHAVPQYSKIRTGIDKINRLFGQNISGIRVVKAFNKTEYEEKQFSEAVSETYDANVRAESTMMLLSPLVTLAANMLIVVILWIGAGRIDAKTLQIGILVAIIEYVTMALNNVQQLSTIITIVPRSQVSLKRIEEILSAEEKVKKPIQDNSNKKDRVDKNSRESEGISFKNVTFYYPESNLPAVSDFNTLFVKGNITAIIGSTGSGKSTLLQLLMRNFDTSEGDILIDSINVEKMTNDEYNKKITLVPQKTFLFGGTVRENIQVGKADASDEEIWEVLDISEMGDFFRSEEGLDTHISQNASNLSGGQKQRLSIARALIRDTDYYLFDDCFSALDYTTESKIRKAVIKRLKDKTILVVAQRVATVKNANKILVMDDGKLVDSGSHEELITTCKIYNEIVASQNQEEVK